MEQPIRINSAARPARAFAHVIFVWLSLFASPGVLLSPAAAAEEEFQIKFFDFTEGQLAFSYVKGEARDIYVIDFGTLETRPLIQTPAKEETPEFSPDGKKIVYASEVKGLMQIYVADADGTHGQKISNTAVNNENPSWSPDGKQVIYQSANGNGADLILVNADGSKPQTIFKNSQKNTNPRISPRGGEILFASNQDWPGWDIYLYDQPTKKASILTKGAGSFLLPSWHPLGGRFVFAHAVGSNVGLWMAARGSQDAVRLTAPGPKYADPRFSPDGKFLFCVQEATAGKSDFQLLVSKVEPSGEIAEAPQFVPVMLATGAVRHPTFSPYPSLASLTKRLARKAASERNPSSE